MRFKSTNGFLKEIENAPSNSVFLEGLKEVGLQHQPADKGRKKRNPRPRMPTIETVEGPDDAGVSDEIKFLEEKYVGNDLIYFQLFPCRRKNPD